MPEKRGIYIFDTVVLSNFAQAGRLDLLISRYGKSLTITREVLGEIIEGVVVGYSCLKVVEETVEKGRILMAKQRSSPDERRCYRELLRTLNAGEASCIACAKEHGGTVVTDDRTARACCSVRGVKYTGTIGILKACCLDAQISEDDADNILKLMIDAGYYSPVKRISDLLL